jgi:hypothetical protein
MRHDGFWAVAFMRSVVHPARFSGFAVWRVVRGARVCAVVAGRRLAVMRCVSCRSLNLYYNGLSGSIPSTLGNLTALQ